MNTRTITDCLIWVLIGVVTVAGGSGIIRFRRLPRSLRYLALLAAFDMVMELTTLAISQVLHMKSNLFLIPFIAIGEVTLLLLAYREVLQSARFSRAMPWVAGLFGLYALVDAVAGIGVIRYATGVQITSDLIQLSLAMLYFWKLLSELRVEHLRQEPFFWVSVGLVGYVLADLLIALFTNYLLTHYSHELQVIFIRIVRLCFLITLYCAYSLALWMRPQKSNSLSY